MADYSGTSGNDTFAGTPDIDYAFGREGDDSLSGGDNNDYLYGQAGNDTLNGGNGDDWLSAGGGVDALDGGAGWDKADINLSAETGDVVYNAIAAVTDAGTSLANGMTIRNTEGLVLFTGSGNDTLTVSIVQRNFYWIAGSGFDTLVADYSGSTQSVTLRSATIYSGRNGVSYTSSYDGVERFVVTGGTAADNLSGQAGDDSLKGGAGDDMLFGKLGNDTLDGGPGDDRLHYSGGTDVVDGGSGYDTLLISEASAPPPGTNLLFDSVAAATATGFTWYSGAVFRNIEKLDMFPGGRGDDTWIVRVNEGEHYTFYANEGHDILVADFSRVTVSLHTSFDSASRFDTIETADGKLNFSSYGVEVYKLTGGLADDNFTGFDGNDVLKGGSGHDNLTGAAGDDWLDGGTGIDTLVGGKGNDTYVVDSPWDETPELDGQGIDLVMTAATYKLGANFIENLALTGGQRIDGIGNSLNNVLTGNTAGNTLYGGLGADTMIGGGGSDTYMVENAGDVVVELAGQGTDTIMSALSWTLGDYIERLVLGGTGDLSATGNGLANLLTGNAGANRLDGQGGADVMAGGRGNDTYIIDDAGDRVVEYSGNDAVYSSVSFSAKNQFIEVLGLTGADDIDLTGNGFTREMSGNSGDNNLFDIGGFQVAMAGGAGEDTFAFSGISGSGRATISDFSATENDMIDVSHMAGGYHLSQSGSDVVITTNYGVFVITVLNTSVADLSGHLIA